MKFASLLFITLVFSAIYYDKSIINFIRYSIYSYNPKLNNLKFDKSNVLSGKKWTTLGDSFTSNGYSNKEVELHKIEDGLYKGKMKVYPYLIGNRNNMNIINLAAGGMSIANTQRNSMTHGLYPVYKMIPKDSDYITIKIGINDNNNKVKIGDISDTNNKTFYGAYNEVLEYITKNYKTSKIGIIITNGSSKGYTDATIKLAKKFNIKYIDEVNDQNIPLLHRVDRLGISKDEKEYAMKKYAISETNTHPNDEAHYVESLFIEKWLRTL